MHRLFLIVALLASASYAFAGSDGYDRSKFMTRWPDDNKDCMNLRHELLAKTAILIGQYDDAECRILRGKWYGPYTDSYYFSSSDLDIDHLVPLKWAWDHGASDWDSSKRQLFATDARFLIAVDKSANRSKSDKWPVEWLPPNQKYHCSYISIFSRAVLIHEFILTDDETGALDKLLRAACDSNP
jgi:hypothetical protein